MGGPVGRASYILNTVLLLLLHFTITIQKCKNFVIYHSPLSHPLNLPPHRVTRMDMGEKNCNPVLLSTTMDAAPTHPIHCPSELGFDGIVFISVRQQGTRLPNDDPSKCNRPWLVPPPSTFSCPTSISAMPTTHFISCSILFFLFSFFSLTTTPFPLSEIVR